MGPPKWLLHSNVFSGGATALEGQSKNLGSLQLCNKNNKKSDKTHSQDFAVQIWGSRNKALNRRSQNDLDDFYENNIF